MSAININIHNEFHFQTIQEERRRNRSRIERLRRGVRYADPRVLPGGNGCAVRYHMALFKRMLKIPTQNNKLGIAEKSRSRKILMQEYGLNENFFKEIDASIKKNCKTQNDIKSYFIMYQGFNNDLFSLLDNLMQWKFRFSMLVKKLLYSQTQKTIHEIVTRSEWKDVSVQKVAWRIRKYKETLGYSEEWMTDFVYNVVLMAKEDAKRQKKEDK